ncbi:unnamed protein product, partial [Ilex paraguariensis]
MILGFEVGNEEKQIKDMPWSDCLAGEESHEVDSWVTSGIAFSLNPTSTEEWREEALVAYKK